MKHTFASLLLAVLVGLTASPSHAGGAMPQLKAKISGTVQTQIVLGPAEGKIAKTKLDNARVFEEFGVSPDLYALVFDPSVGLVLVPKSSLAKLPTILVMELGGSASAVDTHSGSFAISAPVDNPDAMANLFENLAGEVQGVAKYRGTFPPTEFTKITLAGFARGHTSDGDFKALMKFKVTASGVFVQTF